MNFRIDYDDKSKKPVRTQAKKINIRGKRVAITGALPGMNRGEAEAWVGRKGGTYSSKVDTLVSCLILGKTRDVKPSSKIVDAQRYKVPMIQYNEVE